MARPGHPLGRARLDLPRWSSPPRDHPVAQPRALETCPRARTEVRLLVRRGSGVLVGEALESVVCGVLTKMVGGVGDGEADLAVACGFDDAIADEAAAGGGDAGVDGGDADGAGRRGVLESVVADELDHEGVAGGSMSGAVEG